MFSCFWEFAEKGKHNHWFSFIPAVMGWFLSSAGVFEPTLHLCLVYEAIPPMRINESVRLVKPHRTIRDAFVEEDRPLSPDEVLENAKRYYGKLGIATVYRNIQSLVEEDWLQPVEIPGNPPRYEVAGKAHHHHFQCNRCKKLYEHRRMHSFEIKAASGIPRYRVRILPLWNVCGVCATGFTGEGLNICFKCDSVCGDCESAPITIPFPETASVFAVGLASHDDSEICQIGSPGS